MSGACEQCVQRVHHPHHGHPYCYDDPDCGCDGLLWCQECAQPWPCATKQAHEAERAARKAAQAAPAGGRPMRVVDNRRSRTATPAPIPPDPDAPPGPDSWRLTPDLVQRLTVAYNCGRFGVTPWRDPGPELNEAGLRALLLAMSRCGLLARPFDPEA